MKSLITILLLVALAFGFGWYVGHDAEAEGLLDWCDDPRISTEYTEIGNDLFGVEEKINIGTRWTIIIEYNLDLDGGWYSVIEWKAGRFGEVAVEMYDCVDELNMQALAEEVDWLGRAMLAFLDSDEGDLETGPLLFAYRTFEEGNIWMNWRDTFMEEYWVLTRNGAVYGVFSTIDKLEDALVGYADAVDREDAMGLIDISFDIKVEYPRNRIYKFVRSGDTFVAEKHDLDMA